MRNFSIACNAQEVASKIEEIEILQSQVHKGMTIGESIFESIVNEPMQEVIDKNKKEYPQFIAHREQPFGMTESELKDNYKHDCYK